MAKTIYTYLHNDDLNGLGDTKHVDDIILVPFHTDNKLNSVTTDKNVFVANEVVEMVFAQLFPVFGSWLEI